MKSKEEVSKAIDYFENFILDDPDRELEPNEWREHFNILRKGCGIKQK
jgi:hypothetical protein